jgi:hypothetical protein
MGEGKLRKKWIPLLVIIVLGASTLTYRLFRDWRMDVPELLAYTASDYASAIRGSYSWKNWRQAVHADTDHPLNFTYGEENTLVVFLGETVTLTPMAGGKVLESEFTLDSLEVFDGQGRSLGDSAADAEVSEGEITIKTPAKPGGYTYVLVMTFDQGTVSYGLEIRTDQAVLMKGLELYLWKDAAEGGKVWFTLLPGTNRDKEEAEVRNPVVSEDQVAEMRKKLSIYPKGTEVFIYQVSSEEFSEAEFKELINALTEDLPQTFHDVGIWRE